jgi:hypothetical protein
LGIRPNFVSAGKILASAGKAKIRFKICFWSFGVRVCGLNYNFSSFDIYELLFRVCGLLLFDFSFLAIFFFSQSFLSF